MLSPLRSSIAHLHHDIAIYDYSTITLYVKEILVIFFLLFPGGTGKTLVQEQQKKPIAIMIPTPTIAKQRGATFSSLTGCAMAREGQLHEKGRLGGSLPENPLEQLIAERF